MTGARILVMKQEGLQQFVEAEPAFAAIRSANPGVPIDLLTTPEFGRLAKGAPYFDRVLAAQPFSGKAMQKEFLAQLKRIGYEQIYDLDGTRVTLDLRAALTGFRGPRWIGPKRVRNRGGRSGSAFSGSDMQKLLSDASIGVDERLPNMQWALTGRKDAANMQPSWFGISGPFALFLPAFDSNRRWPAQNYARLAQELAREGLLSVIVGEAELEGFAKDVVKLAAGKGKPAETGTVIDLTGKADLAQIAMLGRSAGFFVAGATDELHLCVAVGCPGLVLLHPADEEESESLFGRDVIRLTAQDMSKLSPDMALSMLRNMGLLEPQATADLRQHA